MARETVVIGNVDKAAGTETIRIDPSRVTRQGLRPGPTFDEAFEISQKIGAGVSEVLLFMARLDDAGLEIRPRADSL